MGGSPVIRGTRVPIEVILYRLKEGYSIEELHKHYPFDTFKQVQRAKQIECEKGLKQRQL